jgi:hypothetical protein
VAGDPNFAADAHEQHRRQNPDDPEFVCSEVFCERFHGLDAEQWIRPPPR